MAKDNLQSIYNTQSYSWDGNSRPVLSDYIAPWAAVASMTPSKWSTKRGNDKNSAITYAKNMMQNAISQYNSDVDFWNEKDSRRYNSPASQSERYEDAGYNMGYMYGSVSSGNTNSGYSTPDASSDIADNEAPESLVTEVVLPLMDTLGKLANQGVDIWSTVKEVDKINAQTDLYKWNRIESVYRGMKTQSEKALIDAQKEWFDFLRSTTPDGQPVENAGTSSAHTEDSIAFLAESLGYDMKSAEYQDLQAWLKYCDDAYHNQATDPMKDIYQQIDASDMPDAMKSTLKVLAYWATSGGVKTSTTFKR